METLNYNPRKEDIYERRNRAHSSIEEAYRISREANSEEQERISKSRRELAHNSI